MAPPLERVSKLDCATTKGVRKDPYISSENPRRNLSETTNFGVGTSLIVARSSFENRSKGSATSPRLRECRMLFIFFGRYCVSRSHPLTPPPQTQTQTRPPCPTCECYIPPCKPTPKPLMHRVFRTPPLTLPVSRRTGVPNSSVAPRPAISSSFSASPFRLDPTLSETTP